MKKSYIYISLIVALIFSTSCRESYDDYDSGSSPTIGFTLGVEPEVQISGTIDFPVSFFITDVSDEDRSFEIIVDPSTTVSADNYSFESTVVIPANERIGQMFLTITNSSLSEEFEPIALSFVASGGVVSGDKATIFVKGN